MDMARKFLKMGLTGERRHAHDKTWRNCHVPKTIFAYKNEEIMKTIRVGDNVVYNGYTKEQVLWGNNDTPYMLILGRVYIIDGVDIHKQHTKVSVKGVHNMWFNSVHFDVVD